MNARFTLGQVLATPGAMKALTESGQKPDEFLARHQGGDWGECSAEDRFANDQALLDGERLLSVYQTSLGAKIWIISESDRKCTTILLPSEY